jgi:hypothetical protein
VTITNACGNWRKVFVIRVGVTGKRHRQTRKTVGRFQISVFKYDVDGFSRPCRMRCFLAAQPENKVGK